MTAAAGQVLEGRRVHRATGNGKARGFCGAIDDGLADFPGVSPLYRL